MAGNVDHPASHRKPKRYSNTISIFGGKALKKNN
jgi:hypothetical protein